METIDEQFHSISFVDIPPGMHHFVMRKVQYKKLWPFFITVFALLTLNLIIIVWHINTRLIDAEFTHMMKDFFEVFSFNFPFLKVLIESFFEIISPLLVVSSLLSLIGALYTGRKIIFM